MTAIRFEVLAVDAETGARAGLLKTPHGDVPTPAFMPVGTRATVKGLLPADVRALGAGMVLANTYHLMLRPGDEVIRDLGGLQTFSGWNGPMLTDSGGFQVMSLADRLKLDDDGVTFQSVYDGSTVRLTPERAVEIQENLGADVAMVLDECIPNPATRERAESAVRRTLDWALRCREAATRDDQAQFGIVQGSLYPDLREMCARELVQMDFPGYAVGGLSVGEDRSTMDAAVAATVGHLPTDRPRYLMGVGAPRDLVESVARGVDMFDCVLPTRNARNASALVPGGSLRIRQARHRTDPSVIQEGCDCATCARGFSRAYIHHLFRTKEMLGPILMTLHNLRFVVRLLEDARNALLEGSYGAWLERARAEICPG
jgi:queuine tRNA-ribosyltransferase